VLGGREYQPNELLEELLELEELLDMDELLELEWLLELEELLEDLLELEELLELTQGCTAYSYHCDKLSPVSGDSHPVQGSHKYSSYKY
jgi:hypothetical protein